MPRPFNVRALMLLLVSPALALFASAPPAATAPAARLQLFNQKDLANWTWHASKDSVKIDAVWTVKDGVLHCAGKPPSTGYIEYDKDFKNFTLTVEFRHVTADNGGIFICINGEPKVWPNGVQIQGNFGKVGDLLNQNAAMKKMTTDPARTSTVGENVVATRITPAPTPPPDWQPEKPLGEWNTLVITMKNGHLEVRNNGLLLNQADDITPDHGKIGLQAEGAEMEFRKIELIPGD